MYSVPSHGAHNEVSTCLLFLFQIKFGAIFEDPFILHGEPSCTVCQYVMQGERNILADLYISQVGSVLGGELMSIVSSAVVVRLTVGLYQFVSTDAYRSHSDMLQQGGRHRRRGEGGRGGSMSYDGVKRLVQVEKSGLMEVKLFSLGCHAKQKASEKSTSHENVLLHE